MDIFSNWIVEHAGHAHWLVFTGILLAGFSLPISADLLIIASAVLAATVVPENLWILFSCIFFGCLFSAHIAYWVGRVLGRRLLKWRHFAKIFPNERLQKIQNFYNRYGFFTLLLGRFIPFGVRNAIFMTTGMSKVPFFRFALRDLVACLTWTSISFFCFFWLGQSYEAIKDFLKSFHLFLFLAFGVTVIAFIWYKRKKKITAIQESSER